MIEVKGNYIYREGIRIAWLNGNYLYDNHGKKLGYFTVDTVYNTEGERVAHIDGEFVFVGNKQMDLGHLINDISAAGLSNGGRLAIDMFLGE